MSLPNGRVSGDCGGDYGNTCRYVACQDGYTFSTGGVDIRVCEQDGKYNGTAKACVIVTCPPLSAPTHGEISGECSGEYNSVCRTSCSTGFVESTAGNSQRTCSQDGQYTGTPKTCGRIITGDVVVTATTEAEACTQLQDVVQITGALKIRGSTLARLSCLST